MPDVDGLGIVPVILTRHSTHPLDWISPGAADFSPIEMIWRAPTVRLCRRYAPLPPHEKLELDGHIHVLNSLSGPAFHFPQKSCQAVTLTWFFKRKHIHASPHVCPRGGTLESLRAPPAGSDLHSRLTGIGQKSSGTGQQASSARIHLRG